MIDVEFTSKLKIEADLDAIVPQIKNEYKSVIIKGKEFRNLRQTVFYQPTDYYVYEPPSLPDDQNEENIRDTFAKPETVEQKILKQIDSLNIYGSIKTICPTEFFISETWQNFRTKNLKVMKINRDQEKNTYKVDFADLVPND